MFLRGLAVGLRWAGAPARLSSVPSSCLILRRLGSRAEALLSTAASEEEPNERAHQRPSGEHHSPSRYAARVSEPPRSASSSTAAKFNLANTIGVRCIIGSRPYQEDRFKYEVITRPNGDHLYYFAVFDGHAGDTTSDFLSRHLHVIFAELLERNDECGGQLFPSNQAVLSEAFRLANAEIERLSIEENWRSGSTASVLVVDLARNEMAIGQVGDSRIVLCSSGRGIGVAPEHTPHEPEESKRVREAGGSIFVGSDGVPRLCGMLTVTRAFGDLQLRQHGLIGEPWLGTRTIQRDEDSFVILGTDGLFGLVTPQEACDIVKRARSTAQAAELLVDEAQLLSTEDNATCIVVPLYAWNKHRETDYTQMLRRFKVSHVFGSTISELPPCLASQLAQGNVRKRDLVQKLWKNFDEDEDGLVTPDELTKGLRKVGARPSQEEIDLIFSIAGSSDSGRITLHDFLQQFQQGDEFLEDDDADHPRVHEEVATASSTRMM